MLFIRVSWNSGLVFLACLKVSNPKSPSWPPSPGSSSRDLVKAPINRGLFGAKKWPPFRGINPGHDLKKLVGGGFQHVFVCHPESFFGDDPRIDLETCFFEKIETANKKWNVPCPPWKTHVFSTCRSFTTWGNRQTTYCWQQTWSSKMWSDLMEAHPKKWWKHRNLRGTGWWFQICFVFTPTWGRFLFWLIFFRMGWNHQPEIYPGRCFLMCFWWCWNSSTGIQLMIFL